MQEIFATLIVVFLMAIVVCILVALILRKDVKDFHMSFELGRFDISGSFFGNNSIQEDK